MNYGVGGYAGAKGRPMAVELSEPEAEELRRRYVKSNRNRHAGSMTLAARTAAKDPKSGLSDAARAAILDPRKSKHALTTAVKRACRGECGDSLVAMYRDNKKRILEGMYLPGMLRMAATPDGGLRRLMAGERQSWDDASINFCVAVPFPSPDGRGVAWRAARFQLLAGIDDSTDFCVGWGFVVRMLDSYQAGDIISVVSHAWRDAKPDSVMFEGGSWQSKRAVEFLESAGVRLVSAKGRTRNKLIEGWWNRLWTALSIYSDGQIGRYRGEMRKENDLLMKCRAGSLDPLKVFPDLSQALAAIQRGIDFLQHERIESAYAHYGSWVPSEMYAAGIAARRSAGECAGLQGDFGHLAARVREERKVCRGMCRVRALSPMGDMRPYHFAGPELEGYEGAPVWVAFDPFERTVAADVRLARRFKDWPAGHVVGRAVPCLDAYPRFGDEWDLGWADAHEAAARAKRLASSLVRRELRRISADGSRMVGKSEASGPQGVESAASIGGSESGGAVAALPDAPPAPSRPSWRSDLDRRMAEAEEAEAEMAFIAS